MLYYAFLKRRKKEQELVENEIYNTFNIIL